MLYAARHCLLFHIQNNYKVSPVLTNVLRFKEIE